MGSGFGKSKGKKTNFGSYYRTPEEYEAMVWCLKNKIVVAPLAADKVKTNPQNFYIDIIIQGRLSRSPNTFDAKELWPQIYKYYKYYYDKHRKSV